MAERWASQCAKLERGSIGFVLEATQKYAWKRADGWSPAQIAREVTEAGFSISGRQIERRLKALAAVEGIDAPSMEDAFAKAYTDVNQGDRAVLHTTPKTVDDAESIARSLKKAPQAVQEVVLHRLQPERTSHPVDRKNAEAAAHSMVAPVTKAVAGMGIAAAPEVIEEIADDVREANEADAITPALLRRFDKALAKLNEELEVARFKLGMEVQ